MKSNTKNRLSALLLFVAMLTAGLVSQVAVAAMVSTDSVVAQQEQVIDRAELAAALEREDVQASLEAYGVSPEEAAERVAALTDEEIRELSQNIDALPAGGSGTVTILLLVIIILLLL
jgi:hypothetical protein